MNSTNPMTLTSRRPRHRSLAALAGSPPWRSRAVARGCGSGAAGPAQRPMDHGDDLDRSRYRRRVAGEMPMSSSWFPTAPARTATRPAPASSRSWPTPTSSSTSRRRSSRDCRSTWRRDRFAFADHIGAGASRSARLARPDPDRGRAPGSRGDARQRSIPPTRTGSAAVPALRRASSARSIAVGEDGRDVPPAPRKLVTSHELIGYFADRYGFEVLGAPFGCRRRLRRAPGSSRT